MHFYIDIKAPFSLRKLIAEAAQANTANIELIGDILPEDIDDEKAAELQAKDNVFFCLDIKAGTRADAEEIANAIVEAAHNAEPYDCDPEPEPEEEPQQEELTERQNQDVYEALHPELYPPLDSDEASY